MGHFVNQDITRHFVNQDILSMGHFVEKTFCQWDILLKRHFVNKDILSTKTFCQWDILSMGHIVNGIYCQWDILSMGHFVNGTLCQQDILSKGQSDNYWLNYFILEQKWKCFFFQGILTKGEGSIQLTSGGVPTSSA
jgi:hypothetical protein